MPARQRPVDGIFAIRTAWADTGNEDAVRQRRAVNVAWKWVKPNDHVEDGLPAVPAVLSNSRSFQKRTDNR